MNALSPFQPAGINEHKRKETNPQCFTTGMPPKTLYPPMDSTKISEFDHKYPIDAYANFLPESRKFG